MPLRVGRPMLSVEKHARGNWDKACILANLANERRPSLTLSSTIRHDDFKHNDVLMKNLVNMRLGLSIILYIDLIFFLYRNIELYKFIDKFKIYQIIIYNLLII